jgi:hypothetical protein
MYFNDFNNFSQNQFRNMMNNWNNNFGQNNNNGVIVGPIKELSIGN